MLKLKKLYHLLNRNVELNLINSNQRDVYFYGTVKDIPDKYDDYGVLDIIEHSTYEYTIVINGKSA